MKTDHDAMNRLAVTLIVTTAIVGCGINHAPAAVEHAARDGQCPRESIRVEELGGDRYKTVGCGRTGVYECWNEACWKEGRLASQARKQAARDLGCDAVEVSWIQDDIYGAKGCG